MLTCVLGRYLASTESGGRCRKAMLRVRWRKRETDRQTKRERERGRERDRDKHRQTDRDRQTDRQRIQYNRHKTVHFALLSLCSWYALTEGREAWTTSRGASYNSYLPVAVDPDRVTRRMRGDCVRACVRACVRVCVLTFETYTE